MDEDHVFMSTATPGITVDHLDKVGHAGSQYRIAHVWGHGEWHGCEHFGTLSACVEFLNRRHGAGTHWLEMR